MFLSISVSIIQSIDLSMDLYIHTYIQSFIHSFVRSFTHLFAAVADLCLAGFATRLGRPSMTWTSTNESKAQNRAKLLQSMTLPQSFCTAVSTISLSARAWRLARSPSAARMPADRAKSRHRRGIPIWSEFWQLGNSPIKHESERQRNPSTVTRLETFLRRSWRPGARGQSVQWL